MKYRMNHHPFFSSEKRLQIFTLLVKQILDLAL